jgi:hypothetical protein
MSVVIQHKQTGDMLAELIGKEVTVDPADACTPHPATYRGLVTNDDKLVGVIASDLDFAHRTAAALAIIPAGRVSEPNEDPEEDLIMIYIEVANVLSRLANEAAPARVRIDPGMDHPDERIEAVIERGKAVFLGTADVEGYGRGNFGIWMLVK